MKKKYLSPELDVILLESADVITASVSGDPTDKPGSSEDNAGGWNDWG